MKKIFTATTDESRRLHDLASQAPAAESGLAPGRGQIYGRRGGGDLVRFVLTGTLAQGGTASATIWVYADGNYKDSGEVITVSDEFLGMFEGVAGQRGIARLWPDSGKYEILQFPCPVDETL